MNDQELDDLIARATPVTDEQVASWDLAASFTEVCEEIMSNSTVQHTPDQADTTLATVLTPGPSGRPRWRRFAAVAAVAAAIIGISLVVNVRGETQSPAAWAAPLVEFAQRSPLILLNDPQWIVTRADEFDAEQGEMTFGNVTTAQEADLTWRNGRISDSDEGLTNLGSRVVVNRNAEIIRYDGYDTFAAVWVVDGRLLEFRSDQASVEDFYNVLDKLTAVDVDAWLSAMPASVIEQADQPAVIAEMLTGMPLPNGFDVSSLDGDADISDRYQLGVRVVGSVSCAWIESWLDATESGDQEAAQAATDALNTYKNWPIVDEMNKEGAYGLVLAQYVTAVTNNADVYPGGDGPTVKESYRTALGCP